MGDSDIDSKLHATPLAIITRWATLFAGLSVMALAWGFDVQTALSAIGILSLGISMSLKEVFEDLFDLIILCLDRPYHLGSEVSIGGIWGTVEAIGFRSTRLRDYAG